MKYSHTCFGSRLDITIYSAEDAEKLVKQCFMLVDDFEEKYSRFKKWNFLSELNQTKKSKIDAEFLSLINLSLKVSHITKGYFDITLLPVLENIGYGVDEKKQKEVFGYENIVVSDDTIELKNGISLDIWAVWKGYMVDKIFNFLDWKIEKFTINFGWDMRVKWRETVYLEDPADDTKSIGLIELENMSIASSAGNKRVFSGGHHLINPKTRQSQNDKITLYVSHKLSSFADIFSTALFVTPLKQALQILEETKWLEALIIAKDGSMYKSRWFHCNLNTRNISEK